MSIAAGIAALTAALKTIKALAEIDKDLSKAELKMKMADLHGSLADARIALSDAREELAAKDREILRLSETKAGRLKTVQHRGYSFGIGNDGKPIGRPYCPVCEQQGAQVQLTRVSARFDICPKCKAPYSGHPFQLPANLAPAAKAVDEGS